MTEVVYALDDDGYPQPKKEIVMATKTSPVKKPVAAKRGAVKGQPAPRWSDADVAKLTEAVASEPTAKAAFEKVARELGKQAGSVQQKWYNLQKASGSASTRRGRPGGSTGQIRAARRSGSAQGLSGGMDVSQLDSTELVRLAQAVSAEVERRQAELAAAQALFA